MKIILPIIIVLLAAAVVSAGFNLIANHTGQLSAQNNEGGINPQVNNQNQSSATNSNIQPSRDFGERDRGTNPLEMLVTFFQVTIITFLVIILQNGISLLKGSKQNPSKAAE